MRAGLTGEQLARPLLLTVVRYPCKSTLFIIPSISKNWIKVDVLQGEKAVNLHNLYYIQRLRLKHVSLRFLPNCIEINTMYKILDRCHYYIAIRMVIDCSWLL